MGSIRLQWSTYDLTLAEFAGGELPRNFVSTAALNRSATGAQVYSGAPYAAKYIWAINAICDEDRATTIMNMFAGFDSKRAQGELPQITVTDTTFGATINADGVFTTAPSVSRWGGPSSLAYSVAFGITQV